MNIAVDTARRPGRPKSEEKAEAIREAASHLFMTVGMERTSMDAVAQAAGVSKQTVYSHFKSKDDLFRACIASKVQMYGLDKSKIDPSAPVDIALRRVGHQFLTLLGDPDVICMFRLMISEATSFPRVVHTFFETGPHATVDYVRSIFAQYLTSGGEEVAQRATCDYLALLKGDYLMERLLDVRDVMADAEREEHVDRCVAQLRRLYEL